MPNMPMGRQMLPESLIVAVVVRGGVGWGVEGSSVCARRYSESGVTAVWR